MTDQGDDVNMEESNISQADAHPAGSMTPAKMAQAARNGSSTPAQEEEFPTETSRTPQSDLTPGPTVTRRVTNEQLRAAVKVAMLQDGKEFATHMDQLVASGAPGFNMLSSFLVTIGWGVDPSPPANISQQTTATEGATQDTAVSPNRCPECS